MRFYWKVAVWSLIMIFVLLYPFRDLQSGSDLPYFDKIAHAFLFTVCAFLFILARLRHMGMRLISRKIICQLIIFITLFGALIEILQSLMDLGREGSFGDLLADLTGIAFGWFSYKVYFSLVYRD